VWSVLRSSRQSTRVTTPGWSPWRGGVWPLQQTRRQAGMARPLHGKAVFWGGSVQRAARQISIHRVFSPKHVEPQQNSLIQTDCAPTGLEHHMTQRLQPVTKLKTRHDRPPMRLFSAVARSERDMLGVLRRKLAPPTDRAGRWIGQGHCGIGLHSRARDRVVTRMTRDSRSPPRTNSVPIAEPVNVPTVRSTSASTAGSSPCDRRHTSWPAIRM
jgi:hypothetical protein